MRGGFLHPLDYPLTTPYDGGMTSTQFNDLINRLAPGDFDVIRGYVLDTVRAEFGPLITALEDRMEPVAQSAGPDYPLGYDEDARSRTFEMDLRMKTERYVVFGGSGVELRTDLDTWEEAGSPRRIQIVATVA